jgi:LPXTG-site transpeptidase (sortase) family protein
VTLTQAPPPGARNGPGGGASREGQAAAALAARRAKSRQAVAQLVTSTAIFILGGSLLGFAMWIMAGSRLHYDRIQHDSYAPFRAELAQAIAPTGPTDPLNPKKLLAPGSPVAVLTIPEMGLDAVVLEGTSGQVLEGGPGHLRDTQLPGQAGISVIMGRRATYGGPFARLSSLSPGQLFTVTTGQGVFHYRVLDARNAGDPVPAYSSGQGRLILVTAAGPAYAPSGVLRVDANLVSKPQPAPAMIVSPNYIGPSEAAMGTDAVAWVPLVLWGQGLLIAAIALGWMGAQWGRWQTWVVAIPVVGFFGLAVADQVARLLPNLM